MRKNQKGFTLVELIAIIVILTVLGGVVLNRFMSQNSSQLQSSRDDLIAALFYAQQTAMARGGAANPITFELLDNNTYTVRESGSTLSTTLPFPLDLASGVTITSPATPFTLSFDKLGRIGAATSIVLNGSTTITVEASGYARR